MDNMDDKESNRNHLDERLDELFGIGGEPSNDRAELSNYEKREIKKMLVITIWIVVIVGILMIVLWFIRPFDKKNKLLVDNNNNLNTPIEYIYSSLNNGNLDVNLEAIKRIDSIYNFNFTNPLYNEIYNVFSENLVIEDASDETKLFLLSSNDEFNETISNKITSYDKDNQIIELNLSKDELNTIINDIYGESYLFDCEYFYFAYKLTSGEIFYFKGTLENNNYIFEYVETKLADIRVYTGLISASKRETTITLNYGIVFVNDMGIYTDKNCKNLLSTDIRMAKYYALTGEIYEVTYIFNPETDDIKLQEVKQKTHIAY